MMKKIFLLAMLGILLISCSDDSESDLEQENTTTEAPKEENTDNNEQNSDDEIPQPQTRLTYNRDIAPIINNSCMPCHGNPTTNGAPFGLTNFNEVLRRSDRMQARMNNASRPMPVSGLLPASIRAQFDQWITDGRLEE